MEEEPGQVTMAVSHACLRFKNPAEAKGEIFVKCTFVGQGASIFIPSTPGDSAGEPLLADTIASPLPPSIGSTPVEIVAIPPLQGEIRNGSPSEDVVSSIEDGTMNAAKWSGSTIVDVGFRFDSAKFVLTEHTLSLLENTEMIIDLYLRGDGEDDAQTTIGTALVRVGDALRGKNEWAHELIVGTYTPPDADAKASDDLTMKMGEEEGAEKTEQGIEDFSLGPLEFGGSTSTIRVTMMTDDDTADFTVGAGSLWADGAEVFGVPEAWKVQPPPETKHASWNFAIAQLLAGQPQHEFSVWWGACPKALEEEAGEEERMPLPPLQLDGGILSYVPDDDSALNSDSKGNAGSAGAAILSTNGEGGSAENSASTPVEPPTGTWSVRFPSSRNRSFFFHRTSIRTLRRALMSGNGNQNPDAPRSGPVDKDESPRLISSNAALLPVYFERRQLALATPTEGEQLTKGGKKGKKGKNAAPEQPAAPPESPWKCHAVFDLSPIAKPITTSAGDDRNGGRRGSSALSTCVAVGDSPLRVTLEAALTPKPPQPDLAAVGAETEGGISSMPPTTAEGIKPSDNDNADSTQKSPAEEAESQLEQMKAADTKISITFSVGRPLVKAPVRQQTTESVSDIFTPKDAGPRKPSRDVDVELKEELDTFVSAILEEYAKLFLEPSTTDEALEELTAEDREKRLFYELNSGGVYHSFLERLKPRVQRIVRKRFGAVPVNSAESDAFISRLYAHLVEQAAVVLNTRLKNIEAEAVPSYITTDEEKSLEERVEHLGILADDAEAREFFQEAAVRHEDRIEAATEAAAARADWRILLAQAWENYGRFSLRSGCQQEKQHQRHECPELVTNRGTSGKNANGHLDHAARCLEESLSVYLPGSEESLRATTALAAVAVEQGQLDRASALIETARETRLPKLEEGADGYETDQLTTFIPRRDHALACLLRDLMSDPSGARRSLLLAVLSSKREGASGINGAIISDDEPGAPRRTAVRVMYDACTWLLELGLPKTARRAFTVAEESERLAVKKAKARGLPTRTPTVLRETSRRLQCYLLLAEDTANGVTPPVEVEGGDNGDGREQLTADQIKPSRQERAELLAREAVELIPEDPKPWQALAAACDGQGAVKASEAIDAWMAVLDRTEESWHSGEGPVPPLRVYMRLGSLYSSLGDMAQAKACFLRCCRAWRAPGPWLGCGSACMRLEQWEEAEEALQHASRLDPNSPLVWGHMALLLLSQGEDRLEEANRALSQAFRLGFADPSLLREIGNCYVATGRLEAAEEVLRMSLAADINSTPDGVGGVGNPHTRRRLADVLSARNSTSQAVDEYRRVLESPSADETERREVLSRCGTLLRKMGRGNELEQLRQQAYPSRGAINSSMGSCEISAG